MDYGLAILYHIYDYGDVGVNYDIKPFVKTLGIDREKLKTILRTLEHDGYITGDGRSIHLTHKKEGKYVYELDGPEIALNYRLTPHGKNFCIEKRRESQEKSNQEIHHKKKFKLELSHKIGLAALFVAILVFLFGNNIWGRLTNKENTEIKNSEISITKPNKDDYFEIDTNSIPSSGDNYLDANRKTFIEFTPIKNLVEKVNSFNLNASSPRIKLRFHSNRWGMSFSFYASTKMTVGDLKTALIEHFDLESHVKHHLIPDGYLKPDWSINVNAKEFDIYHDKETLRDIDAKDNDLITLRITWAFQSSPR